MSLMVLMAGAACSPALAADGDPAGSPGEQASEQEQVKTNRIAAVPVSQTENDINGRHVLTKVFEVNPGTDPETLKEDGMTVGGYTYELISFTKETDNFEDSQTVSEPQTLPLTARTSEAAYKEAVASFAPTIDYDQDGYVGTLYLDNNSIEVSETGRSNKSGTDSVTKSYTMPYNDDDSIPSSIDYNGKTYTRSSISWADGEYGEDGTMPENYVATVRYTRGYTYSTVNGYQATATYAGEVSYRNTSIIRYKAEYLGTPVSGNVQAMGNLGNGQYYIDENGNPQPVSSLQPQAQQAAPVVQPADNPMNKTILIAVAVLLGIVFVLALGVAILMTLMISNNKKNQQLMQMQAQRGPVMLLGSGSMPQSASYAPPRQYVQPQEPIQPTGPVQDVDFE